MTNAFNKAKAATTSGQLDPKLWVWGNSNKLRFSEIPATEIFEIAQKCNTFALLAVLR